MPASAYHSWIQNEPRESTRRRPFPSPFNGELMGEVHESQPLDFIQALAPAKKTQEAWEQTSASSRAEILRRVGQLILERRPELTLLIASTEGLTADFVQRFLLEPTADLFTQVASDLEDSASLRAIETGQVRATGLLSLISPSVGAFRWIGERLAPALAAGNAVFAKVGSGSPATAQAWGSLLREASVPAGLVNFFVMPGSAASALFVSHPSLHGVSFSGRPANASLIAKAGAEAFKKLQISSGAKNALLILPDAPIEDFDRWVEPCLAGQGRWGYQLSTIYVTEARAEEFFDHLEKYFRRLSAVDPKTQSTLWTPFSSAQGREEFAKARDLALSERAHAIVDGAVVDAAYVRPLVLKDLTHCSTLQTEEIAAPVLIVNVVKYAHEMAKWVNTGDYGFCASIWGPEEKAQKMAAKLRVGRVWINGWLTEPTAFAGLRKSFFGIPDFRWNGPFFSDIRN